jgi:ABC-type tungstate transport system substrate-binding protein
MAAIIAGVGSALSEVAAIAILGGNIYGYDQTLASSTLYYVNGARYEQAVAVAIVLGALIGVLMGGLGLLQQRVGIRMRFQPET